MGRLRLRSADNNKWVDICQSEWYVRNQDNTGWIRITPMQGIKARHGSNNYWVNITCESDEECGDDIYGGTEDGKGDNNTGSQKPQPPDQGYPGETDGGGGVVDPWDPDTYVPPPVISPPTPGPGEVGGNSPGNPDYTDPNANESEEGVGDTSCESGTYVVGSYPPGFDLPDICGPEGGLTEDENGDPIINRPGSGTTDTYDGENGQGTGDGDGNEENSYTCPATINTSGDGTVDITEFYVDLGTTKGTVNIEYANHVGINGIVVYSAGRKVATTDGGTSGKGKLSFEYDPATTSGDSKIFVRVKRVGGNVGRWTVTVSCPGEESIGTITNPAPCLGTFEPKAGTGNRTEIVHEMGATPGTVNIDYQMWNVADSMKVFYGSSVVASTNGPTTGEGTLTFNYVPVDNNQFITIRIESLYGDTTWAYKINCPGTNGTESNPKPCDPNLPVASGGAGRTDMYFDLGATAGQARVRYQAWQVPDTFTVYQNNVLIATTGEVTGEGYLPFNYNPANGDVHIVVQGNGQTTWAFIMECPQQPTAPVNCGTTFTSDGSVASTVVTLTGVTSTSFAYIEYATVAPHIDPPTGAADALVVSYDGVEVESTGNVLRWADKGFGALVVPMTAGVNSMGVEVTSTSWWSHTTYCPSEYVPVIGMSQFMKGVPHVYESSGYDGAIGNTVKQIASTSNLQSKPLGAQVLMTMFRSAGGQCTFTGFADDYAYLYAQASGSSSVIEIGPFVFPNVGVVNVNLPAGTYFLTAVLEETTSNSSTPSILSLSIGSGGKIVNVTSKDWYGCYFENAVSFGTNNPILPSVSARIYDTDAQATNYMSTTGAPSPENIFNTWQRFNGSSYFPDRNAAESNAPGTGAATWQYNAGTSSFEQQSNVSQPNGIVSHATYGSYTFEATIQSNDSDDDANGMIIAYVRDGAVNKSLVVARSGGGIAPTTGLGLLYIEDGGIAAANITPVSTISAWSGAFTRIVATRSGNIINFNASDWNSTSPGANYTIDLTSDPRFAVFMGQASIGFYTHSQAQSRFYDVVAPGLAGEPVFAYDTGKIWEYSGSSWNLLGAGLSFSSKLGNYKLAVSSANGASYQIYRRIQRKL